MPRLTSELHPFLTPDVLTALFDKAIYTCSAFVRKKTNLLAQVTELDYGKISKIKDAILMKYSSPLRKGDKYYLNVLANCALISTGIERLDGLLDGGFMTGNVYELCGHDGSGKTQLCLTASLNICQTTPHEVLYMDTKYDMHVQRLLQMLHARRVTDATDVLEKIKICHPTSACKLLNDLHHLGTALTRSDDKFQRFKIVVIDSLPMLFQTFHNMAESLAVLNNIANILHMLSSEFHLAVIVTNFVTSWTNDPDGDDVSGGGETKELPALGKYWSHVPNVRILVKRRGCLDECDLTVLKSGTHPIGKSVRVQITDAGVV